MYAFTKEKPMSRSEINQAMRDMMASRLEQDFKFRQKYGFFAYSTKPQEWELKDTMNRDEINQAMRNMMTSRLEQDFKFRQKYGFLLPNQTSRVGA